MTRKTLIAAAGLTALAAIATSAHAQSTRSFQGMVDMGFPFWCTNVGGYNITGSTPAPEVGTCVRGSGTLVRDEISPCQGRHLVDVKWKRVRCR